MNTESIIVEGELFNISFDGKKIIGWLLLITNENDEYLIRQNSGFIGTKKYRIKREIFKSSISLKKYIVSKNSMRQKMKKRIDRKFIGVSLGIILSSVLRNFVNKNWFFGETNIPIEVTRGILNLSIFWFFFILAFFIVSEYRKRKFLFNLNRLGRGSIELIGKGNQTNIDIKKIGIKGVLILLPLFLIIIFTTIVMPFLVQERLFLLLIIILGIMLFYNGDTVLSDKKIEYLINRMEN